MGLLYHAYKKTGNKSYLQSANSMEYLNSLTSNPSYELQFYMYMHSRPNECRSRYRYDINKMVNWCFDRGQVAWMKVVGKWEVLMWSGLVGEPMMVAMITLFVDGMQQAITLCL